MEGWKKTRRVGNGHSREGDLGILVLTREWYQKHVRSFGTHHSLLPTALFLSLWFVIHVFIHVTLCHSLTHPPTIQHTPPFHLYFLAPCPRFPTFPLHFSLSSNLLRILVFHIDHLHLKSFCFHILLFAYFYMSFSCGLDNCPLIQSIQHWFSVMLEDGCFIFELRGLSTDGSNSWWVFVLCCEAWFEVWRIHSCQILDVYMDSICMLTDKVYNPGGDISSNHFSLTSWEWIFSYLVPAPFNWILVFFFFGKSLIKNYLRNKY